jgi:hypothetical protein
MSFVEKHNILSDSQNGFRENKSIEMASQAFIENIQKALDNRLLVTGLFFTLLKPMC